MTFLAIMRIANGHSVTPVVADISAVPNLFGVAVYSFMCQHSLPALLTPISQKSKLTSMFVGDFIVVLTFYMLLCLTAAFCFDHKTIQVDAVISSDRPMQRTSGPVYFELPSRLPSLQQRRAALLPRCFSSSNFIDLIPDHYSHTQKQSSLLGRHGR